jgi:hypothetical protein
VIDVDEVPLSCFAGTRLCNDVPDIYRSSLNHTSGAGREGGRKEGRKRGREEGRKGGREEGTDVGR